MSMSVNSALTCLVGVVLSVVSVGIVSPYVLLALLPLGLLYYRVRADVCVCVGGGCLSHMGVCGQRGQSCSRRPCSRQPCFITAHPHPSPTLII